jgi:hypothetical protein
VEKGLQFFILILSPLPLSEKLVPHIPLLTVMAIGLQKPYTKKEVGTGLELYGVY